MLRVRVATKSDVIGKTCQNCHDFYFIVLDICLALTTAQAKKTQRFLRP